MRTALAILLCLLPAMAWAQGKYDDSATSAWFQSLIVPGTTHGCCDQADCHPTPAEFINGTWLAQSKFGDDVWVVIPAERVLKDPSIFKDAVLCESLRQNGDDSPVLTVHRNGSSHPIDWTPTVNPVWVYCFAEPPQVF